MKLKYQTLRLSYEIIPLSLDTEKSAQLQYENTFTSSRIYTRARRLCVSRVQNAAGPLNCPVTFSFSMLRVNCPSWTERKRTFVCFESTPTVFPARFRAGMQSGSHDDYSVLICRGCIPSRTSTPVLLFYPLPAYSPAHKLHIVLVFPSRVGPQPRQHYRHCTLFASSSGAAALPTEPHQYLFCFPRRAVAPPRLIIHYGFPFLGGTTATPRRKRYYCFWFLSDAAAPSRFSHQYLLFPERRCSPY